MTSIREKGGELEKGMRPAKTLYLQVCIPCQIVYVLQFLRVPPGHPPVHSNIDHGARTH